MTVYLVAHFPTFSFAKIQPVHVRRRHFYWSQNNWLYYAQIGTYFYRETRYSTHSRPVFIEQKDHLFEKHLLLFSSFPTALESTRLHPFERLETLPIWIQ